MSVLRRGWIVALIFVAVETVAQMRPAFLHQSEPVRLEPFPESPLQRNPPTFRWPAKNEPATFELEFSREPTFAEAQRFTTTDLFFRPLQPFAPGRWYWRVRRVAPETEPWQGPESFEIAPNLRRWPIGSWEEWLARIPAEHPRVYLKKKDVPVLRAKVARLGAELESWADDVRGELEKPFSLEEWQSRVPPEADPFMPDSPARKQLVWASKSAARAAAEPALEGAWMWFATGDPWYLERVKARALLIASFDPDGFISERNTGHDLGNIDFGNAVLVHDLGVIYDLMHDQFTPEERARLRAAIAARAAPIFAKMRRAPLELMRAHAWQHGFFDALVGALAICREEPRADEWVALALRSFVAFYPWYGGDDGGSQEGPRYFHGAAMLASLNTLDVFRAAFDLRLEEYNPWFRNNPYFLLYSYPPDGLQTQLGDSNPGHYDEGDDRRTPGGKARIAARRMAEIYRNGHMTAYAADLPDNRSNYTFSEFLRWSLPDLPPPQSLGELPDARLFADVGTVFTHSRLAEPEENVRLIFHASPYGGQGHAHADQNSFHIIAYNEHLLLDSGYFTPTGDPHREQWYVQTMAHNTILVDGAGQQWGDTTGYGTIGHFERNEAWVYFVGQAATAYRETPLERFDRHLVWLKGDAVQTYVFIDDLIAAGGTARRFDWLLHAAQRMDVDETGRTVRAFGEKGEARIQFLEPAQLALTQDDRFNVPAVYWRRGKNFPLPNQWHLKVTPPAAPQQRFVTVVQVSKRGVSKPPVHGVPGGVETAGWRVRLPDGSTRLAIEKLQ
jgi:Heparinase II/III-like protein.